MSVYMYKQKKKKITEKEQQFLYFNPHLMTENKRASEGQPFKRFLENQIVSTDIHCSHKYLNLI